uniref:Uncharacterized protein n=1 Tax=Solanum lycopersicum TaxID=4081 RepID=A0A3Q7FGZ5_SOLLC
MFLNSNFYSESEEETSHFDGTLDFNNSKIEEDPITNLTDPKDKKWGKGKDKIDDEEIAFHRMVSKGSWRFLLGD